MATTLKESDDKMCDACAPKRTIAITACHGCERHFCRKHFNEHRDQLSKHLNNQVDLHDEIRQDLQTRIDRSLKDQLDNDDVKKLLRQIDEWVERTTDACIHAADEARASVKQLFDKTKENDSLTQRLSVVARELEEQQQSENFVECELDRWMKQLEELKNDINRPTKFPTGIIIETRDINWKETIKICQPPSSNKNIEHYVIVLGERGIGKTTFIHYVANFLANKHSFNDRLSQTAFELIKQEINWSSSVSEKKYTLSRYSFQIDNQTILVFLDWPSHIVEESDNTDDFMKVLIDLYGINYFAGFVMIDNGTDIEETIDSNTVKNDFLELSEKLQKMSGLFKHFSLVYANSPSHALDLDCSELNIYDNMSIYFMQNSAYQMYRAPSITAAIETDYCRSIQTMYQIIKKIVHRIHYQA